MSVFVSMGDPVAELAALLQQVPAVKPSPADAVNKILTSECINQLLSADDQRDKTKTIFTVAFSMVASMNVQDVAKMSDRITSCLREDTNNAEIRLWVASALFNSVNVTSIKCRILIAILQFCLMANQILAISQSLSNIDQWIQEWSLDDSAKAQLRSLVSDIYAACDKPDAAQAERLRVLSIKSEDASVTSIQSDMAEKAIAHVFRFGKIMFLDSLLGSLVSRCILGSPMISLLRIMCSGSFDDLEAFCSKNDAVLTRFEISPISLRQYFRSLKICTISFGQQVIPLSEIQKSLSLESIDEAETAFIDAAALGLVDGQIDQSDGSVYLTGSAYLSINEDTWKDLQKRLHSWRHSVGAVLPWSQHVQD